MANGDLQAQAQRVSQAQRTASGMSAQAFKLPDMLRQAITEKFQQSPLYGAREQAAQQVLTSPTRSREELAGMVNAPDGTIFSPTQQQSILASRRAADVVPLMSINDLLQAQTGGLENLIGAGTRAFQAQVAQAQGQAGAEQSLWENMFQQQQQQEQVRQFNEQLAWQQQKAAQTGVAGADDILQTAVPDYGEEPQYSPAEGPGALAVNDQGVVWEFDGRNWVAIGRQ